MHQDEKRARSRADSADGVLYCWASRSIGRVAEKSMQVPLQLLLQYK